MKGKWAVGIEPRQFAWVFRGSLAISERPGGATAAHRRVRRDEEVLWLRHQGFTRVVSIMPLPQGPAGYADQGLSVASYALRSGPTHREVLDACYRDIASATAAGEVVLLHDDEVSDRVLGVLAGYLVWSGRVTSRPSALAAVERLLRRSIGPEGRAIVLDLPTPGAAS